MINSFLHLHRGIKKSGILSDKGSKVVQGGWLVSMLGWVSSGKSHLSPPPSPAIAIAIGMYVCPFHVIIKKAIDAAISRAFGSCAIEDLRYKYVNSQHPDGLGTRLRNLGGLVT